MTGFKSDIFVLIPNPEMGQIDVDDAKTKSRANTIVIEVFPARGQ